MAELGPGVTLSHYHIVSKIGAGGMGEVYLAEDTKLDRKVALKILPADLAANHDRMRRFVQEAKSAAALNHPHIAHIYEKPLTSAGGEAWPTFSRDGKWVIYSQMGGNDTSTLWKVPVDGGAPVQL